MSTLKLSSLFAEIPEDWKQKVLLQTPVQLYNTRTRQMEPFTPLHPPHVGIYVCGPTVYSDPHLGHARAAVVFDVLRRYLTFCGYQVRFVSNITDVGHLEGDADEGEDKIQRTARLLRLEPLQIAQFYTRVYMRAMEALAVFPPDIQPHATCHIPEQIAFIEEILQHNMAYVREGSVYFDTQEYIKHFPFGLLSNRKLEELAAGTRQLRGIHEKKHPADFALWKKAPPQHIMRWKAPWSVGFPGWHIECTVMSLKYLGMPFDIHGGGLDLIFPHHECEIMQAQAVYRDEPVRYWIHNNLITIDGQKMSKSLGNFITLEQVFTGEHPRLSKGYPPAAVRLLILQTHYRSVIDFSDKALDDALRAWYRLQQAYALMQEWTIHDEHTEPDPVLVQEVQSHIQEAFQAMHTDLHTAQALAHIFSLLPLIHRIQERDGTTVRSLDEDTFTLLRQGFEVLVEKILGIPLQETVADTMVGSGFMNVRQERDALLHLLIEVRNHLRKKKEYDLADWIRSQLSKMGYVLQDTPQGTRYVRRLPDEFSSS